MYDQPTASGSWGLCGNNISTISSGALRTCAMRSAFRQVIEAAWLSPATLSYQ